MRRSCCLLLALAVVAPAAACKKSSDPTAEPPASTALAPLPTLTLPAAVPADAAGVMVMRSPQSLFAAIANIDLLGAPEPGSVDQMRSDVELFLDSRLGISLTDADQATAFYVPRLGVAAVVQGTEGTVRGEPVGTVHGVSLYLVDGATVAALPEQLIIGEREAVEHAITAAKGQAPSLRDSGRPLLEALSRRSEGVTMAAAVDVSMLPREFRREAEQVGVEQAMLSYGEAGIRAVAYGRPEAMAIVRDELMRSLDAVVQQADRAYANAMKGDEVWEGLAAVVAHHQWKQLYGRLVPTLEGRRLSLHIPAKLGDPMVLTAFAGMAATIAVPAFTKYMRRSKTAEARIGVAMMFDGAAAFFHEDEFVRGDVTVAEEPRSLELAQSVHRCPNDGRSVGSAGVTPPLSVNCNAGPGGMCVPVDGQPRGPGEYSIDQWLDNPVWQQLNFIQEQPHAFHYDFRWNNTEEGFGACQFTAQAFGDLDDDRMFSTFERSGAADENGVNAAAGLYIAREID